MGRTPELFRRPPRDLEGLTAAPYTPGVWDEEYRIAKEDWGHPATIRMREYIRELPAEDQGARKFSMESLFGALMLSVRLGGNLTTIERRLQNDKRLLHLYGLSSVPSRRVISNFRNKTLPRHAPNLEFIRAEAYIRVPVDLIIRFDLDTLKLVVDTTILNSPNTGPRSSKGSDQGAGPIVYKKKFPGVRHGRLKATVMMAGDAPLIVAGLCTYHRSEKKLVADELMPQFGAYSDAVGELITRETGHEHKGFRDSAIIADSAFVNDPAVLAFDAAGLIGLFRQPTSKKLKVRWAIRRTFNGQEEIFPVRTDGAIFCACGDQMVRRPHKSGVKGGFHVKCRSSLCRLGNPRFHVSARVELVKVDENLRVESRKGETKLVLTATIPSYLPKAQALHLKCSNVIESHHAQMGKKFAFGRENARQNKHITDDFQFELYNVLANLLWNFDVGRQLEANGGVGKELDWKDLEQSARRNSWLVAERRKAKKKAKKARKKKAKKKKIRAPRRPYEFGSAAGDVEHALTK